MSATRRTAVMLGFAGFSVALLHVLFGLFLDQKSLIYSPRRYTLDEEAVVLQRYSLPPHTAFDLMAPDKTRLRAYWIPQDMDAIGSHCPTGNGAKIEWGLSAGRKWQKHIKVNFMVVSYRGFGLSQGQPDMEGIRMDSQTALDWLLSKEEIDREKIVLYGHSLGGAVALQLAADNPEKIKAVILENTFLQIARVVFGNSFLSGLLDPLITERWDNERQMHLLRDRAVQGLKIPHILLISGLRDRMVPHWHTERLWEVMQKIPGGQGLLYHLHRFTEGKHACHTQPDYYHHIRSFIEHI